MECELSLSICNCFTAGAACGICEDEGPIISGIKRAWNINKPHKNLGSPDAVSILGVLHFLRLVPILKSVSW